MVEHLFFFAGLTLLLVHEQDAVRAKEWKLFAFLSTLEEESAYRAFTALHIPFYLLVFWGVLGGASLELNEGFILELNVFFMVHVLLHFLLRKHPHYQFDSAFSRFLIVGTGVCGFLDIFFYL